MVALSKFRCMYDTLWKENSCFQLSLVTRNNSYACVNHVCLYVASARSELLILPILWYSSKNSNAGILQILMCLVLI